MERHTLGPWINAGPIGYGRLIDPNIAVVYGPAVTAEAEANARLISAAPDLLEAVAGNDADAPTCLRPIEWLHTLLLDADKIHAVLDGDDPSAVDTMLDELRAMVTKTRAAIAKATGEAAP